MMGSGEISPGIAFAGIVRLFVYAFFMLLLQAHLLSRLPLHALRADLLLPVMFAVGVKWPPVPAIVWASFWGFLADTFSGQFWGLHVGSYMAAVCLVQMASERFDPHNPLYQVFLVGICAAGQSVALGMFLSFAPTDLPSLTSIWIDLGLRTLLCVTLAPFVIYPMLKPRTSF